MNNGVILSGRYNVRKVLIIFIDKGGCQEQIANSYYVKLSENLDGDNAMYKAVEVTSGKTSNMDCLTLEVDRVFHKSALTDDYFYTSKSTVGSLSSEIQQNLLGQLSVTDRYKIYQLNDDFSKEQRRHFTKEGSWKQERTS
ncbi:hypothetical protein NPIL_157231 [Nephila pilipes]|uniref:Uncharacterized protein n=1 Tax=Nephila pilipes TaxID=299642 RepID=A0A8X6PLZ9_NEPPI|nr:hypothetical protein NPIL_157231 [Nephila pilipes]